ncbi:MAG: two-component sensor histidine kinase [Glaciihabitans sp.]|nr:two-component sensor histidine kinase [Glaciihabitans sp.]
MKRIRGLSIRARITIQTLLVALLFCSFAVLIFRANVASVVSSTAGQLLANDAATFEAVIRDAPESPQLTIGEGQFVAIVDPSGTVRRTTLPARLRGSMPALLALSARPTEVAAGGHTYLVRLEHVPTAGGQWAIVSARDQEQGKLLLQRLTTALIVGDLVLVLGFGAAAWLLTAAALRPVTTMRRDAERLSAGGSLEALPVGDARDELAALATTLNAFIEGNRATIEREKQMVSDASHELRTPLAILSAQLELAAAHERDPAKMRAELAAARKTASRLSALASSILELARAETEQPVAPSSWTELSYELGLSIDRARELAQPARILVDFAVLPSSETGTYRISTSGFASVVDNLVANAIHACPEGASVYVELADEGFGLRMTVLDDGPGVPEEYIAFAFDRFSRPDDSRSRAAGGSGLGLAIVHALVTAAGGSVTMENVHPGLRVQVDLPRN